MKLRISVRFNGSFHWNMRSGERAFSNKITSTSIDTNPTQYNFNDQWKSFHNAHSYLFVMEAYRTIKKKVIKDIVNKTFMNKFHFYCYYSFQMQISMRINLLILTVTITQSDQLL